jgi:hypothetical protein
VTDIEIENIPKLKSNYQITVLSISTILSLNQAQEMRHRYDVVEFSTALKPFALLFLIEKNYEVVTYLDPDIQLFGRIDFAIEIARKRRIAVTPHRLTPGSWQSFQAQEVLLLKYGVLNLGFISVNFEAIDFLTWWKMRTFEYATRHPADPVFTDQKWMDLAISYFEPEIIRHFGYNVGPWNLDERTLSKRGGYLYSAEDPLVFIHFSQFDFSTAFQANQELELQSDNWEDANIWQSLSMKYRDSVLIQEEKIGNSFETVKTPFSRLSLLERIYKRDFEKRSTLQTFVFRILKITESAFHLRNFRWWNYGTYGLLVDLARYSDRLLRSRTKIDSNE